MKEVDQQKPWTLSFRAKAKNLDFKLRASKILPACKLFRVTIQFKIRKYLLEFKSEPEPAFPLKPKSLKLKFIQIFRIFRRRPRKNKGILRTRCAHKNYWCGRRKGCIWLWVVVLAMAIMVIMRLRYYFGEGLLWKYFWKAIFWNYAAPSGFLCQVEEVIFDGIRQFLGS